MPSVADSSLPVVVISGAGSGIGLACARRFWSADWRVILLGRNLEKLQAAAADAPAGRAWAIACDVGDARQTAAFAKTLAEKSDWAERAEALVNNAGIYETALTLESDDATWERQLQTNLIGSVRLARALLPGFLARKRGSIVNVASTLGLKPVVGTGAYSATKAAMINWTQTLALECASSGVRVNCVAPGIVETPIHVNFYGRDDAEAMKTRAAMNAAQPLARVGRPEEIAQSVFYFCGPLSEWTTGATLAVDGGIGIA